MAECRQIREMLSRYIDGELSAGEKHELEQHLKLCPSCRSILSSYKNIAAAAAESMKEPPEDFAANVMGAIKKLPEEEKTIVPDKTQKRHVKTIAITFAAAAACLALVLIASPQFFGRSASTKDAGMTASEPESGVVYDMMEEADSNSFGADMASDSCSLAGEASDSDEAAAGGTLTEEVTMACPSSPPGTGQDWPSSLPSSEQSNDAGESKLLEAYFAVIYINGRLPDVLEGRDETASEAGSVEIEIPAETAAALLENGYPADMGNPDAETALVVYTP